VKCRELSYVQLIAAFSAINPLDAKLNPICHLLALLGAHHILHVSRVRVNLIKQHTVLLFTSVPTGMNTKNFMSHFQYHYHDNDDDDDDDNNNNNNHYLKAVSGQMVYQKPSR